MAKLDRSWKDLKRELLQDTEFKKAYEELAPEFQTARAIIALRAAKSLTQEEMAARAAIQRPMLSRLEGAKDLPTIYTLVKLAAAIGAKMEIRFLDRNNKALRRVLPIRLARPAADVRERAR